MSTKIAVSYIRVSKSKGIVYENNELDEGIQRTKNTQTVQSRDAEVLAEFVDYGSSSKLDGESKLKEMLDFVESSSVDYVVVSSVDRLTRDRKTYDIILRRIMKTGCSLIVSDTPSHEGLRNDSLTLWYRTYSDKLTGKVSGSESR